MSMRETSLRTKEWMKGHKGELCLGVVLGLVFGSIFGGFLILVVILFQLLCL